MKFEIPDHFLTKDPAIVLDRRRVGIERTSIELLHELGPHIGRLAQEPLRIAIDFMHQSQFLLVGVEVLMPMRRLEREGERLQHGIEFMKPRTGKLQSLRQSSCSFQLGKIDQRFVEHSPVHLPLPPVHRTLG